MATKPFLLTELAKKSKMRDQGAACDKGSALAAELSSHDQHSVKSADFGPNQRESFESERSYTAKELAEAVDEARRMTALEVEAKMRAAMVSDIELRKCDVLQSIRDQLLAHKAAFEEELGKVASDGQKLAIELVKAVIPRAIEQQPLVDIGDTLQTTLARLTMQPSIEVRLAPDLVDSGAALLVDIANETGFRGEVVTVADQALGVGDVQLCWNGGAIDRRLERLQAEAIDLADYWLDDLSEAQSDGDISSLRTALEPEAVDDVAGRTHDEEPPEEKAMP